MCLLGHFLKEHIRIKFTNEHKARLSGYCDPDNNSEIPQFPDEFEVIDNRKFWAMQVSDFTLLQNIVFGPENARKVARAYYKHTPTVGNFWHFSVRWKVDDLDIETADLTVNERKNLAQKIGSKARAVIMNFAVVDLEDQPGIDNAQYRNN